MKEGLTIGDQKEVKAVVTPALFAQFEGQIVHETYSTVSMVYHMEWAARQIILPYLEQDEEGVGAQVTVRHLAPSPEGTTIRAIATLKEVKGKQIICSVDIWNDYEKIGEGEVIQFIIQKADMQKKLQI